MANRFLWTDLVIPSTLNLSSYLDILLDNIQPGEMIDKLQLGLHEALVNAVQHIIALMTLDGVVKVIESS